MDIYSFIHKNAGLIPGKEKRPYSNSSVYQSARGNFYSYGSHYPLLFKVAGQWFRNTAGYSATTGKHISWAGGAVTPCIDVKLKGSDTSLKNILESLVSEKNFILDQIERGRNGSGIQNRRYDDIAFLVDSIKQVQALM